MINIFIKQSARGPAWQQASGTFTLRISGKDGSSKYTGPKLQREKTTAKILSCELLINAIYVLNIYSKRKGFIASEPVRVNFDSAEAAAMCQTRLKQWKAAGWKNKKGEALPIQYRMLYDTIIKSNRAYIFEKGEENV